MILVAAAFGGGAFVNGPGLHWVQTRVLRSLGLNNSGEITSVDLQPPPGSAPGPGEAGLVKPEAMPAPLAPTPSLVTENESSEDDVSKALSPSRSKPRSRPSPDDANTTRPESSSVLSPTERVSERSRPPLEGPAPDPDVKPASTSKPPANSHVTPEVVPALLDTLAGLLPANPPGSGQSSPPLSAPPKALESGRKPGASRNEDWMILERKMQSLGVTRYSVEGEPGGKVVFSCLIPIAGRQAVTQRFEAEGDDLTQATRATLRRITLWRATQPSSH